MNHRVVFSPEAEEQLAALYGYIAAAASRYRPRLIPKFNRGLSPIRFPIIFLFVMEFYVKTTLHQIIQYAKYLRYSHKTKLHHQKMLGVAGDSPQIARYVKNLGRFLKVLYGVGFFFAFNAPDDVLTQYPLLRGFTSLMMEIFPAISAVANRSEFPEVSTLYLSVSWFFSPLYLLYESGKYYTFDPEKKRFFEIWSKRPTRWMWIKHSMIFLIFTIISFFFMLYYNGRDFNIMPFNSHRVALGLLGWLIAGGGVVIILPSLGLMAFYQVKWIKIFFK
jgi:hypothetical protein